ncbi:MAG: DUF255 domain-containing protein [Armatimonadetes bacterium]|nr:DUF255 domain-containing protein [Armatimonadota bacterium]
MDLNALIEQKGLLLTFGTVFLWGLAMNLTPCVYPMIPITVSYFGGISGGRPGRTFFIALLFVIGLAITYSILGVSAAMGGRLFGASLGNPWMVGAVSVVMVAMGASLLGMFQMTFSSGVLSRIQDLRDRMGWVGALFFGLVAGIVMAPCVGPFIVSLLAFVATKRDPVLGFWLFFVLAFGMGLPYLILGTFTGTMKGLPRPGMWMLWLEHFFGVVLIGFAIWLWRPFMPEGLDMRLIGAYALAAGVYLGFIDKSTGTAGFNVLKKVVGVTAVAAGLWMVATSFTPQPKPPQEFVWQPYSKALLAQAKAEGKPVMIDFYARWCAACNELDHKTYSDPRVIEAAQRFVRIKADLTSVPDGDPNNDESAKPYDLKGLPTVLFIGPDGREIPSLRLEEFAPPARMLELMSKVP